MDTPEEEPDLSLLEIPCIAKSTLPHNQTCELPGFLSIYNYTDPFSNMFISSEMNDQPTIELGFDRLGDNHSGEDEGVNNNSSSVGIKIEPDETGQTSHKQECNSPIEFLFPIPMNFKQEQKQSQQNGLSKEIPTEHENMKGQTSQFTECGFYFSLESKEQVDCIFPGCQEICLGQEAMDLHFNMRHGATNINVKATSDDQTNNNNNNNNYDNDFPSLSLSSSSSSSLFKSQVKMNNNNNSSYNSTVSSSFVFSSKPSKKDSKIPCEMLDCDKRYHTYNGLYKHQFRVHDLLPPPDTIEIFTCTDPDCSQLFVDVKDRKLHCGKIHQQSIVFTKGVNSTDKEFKCPVPSCESLCTTFGRLGKLETHCRNSHPGITFPWCSSEKHIKCPMPNCTRTFNKQTSLESHLSGSKEHRRQNPPSNDDNLSFSSSASTSTSAAAAEIQNLQKVFTCSFSNCIFSTSDLTSFDHHQRLHIGDVLRFRCDFENCGAAFIDEEVMIEHRNAIHGIQ